MSANNYLQENLYQLWKKEEFTDLLVVVEGKEFKCHSAVLCACSDFFKAMMRTKMKETEERVVHLGGITEETFSAILESMYTCVINFNKDNIIPMWFASHQLQMMHAIEKCETFVTKDYLTVENCISLYRHASQLSAEKIMAKSKTCILEKFEQLVKTDSYLDSSFDEIFEIVNFEDLEIKSEDPVIEFILKWVCHVPISICASDDGDSRSSNLVHQDVENDGQNGAATDLAGENEGRYMAQTSASSEPETSNVYHVVKDNSGSKNNSVSQGPGQDVSADDQVSATEDLTDHSEKENTEAGNESPASTESADLTWGSGKPHNTGCSKNENVTEKIEGGDQHSLERKDTSKTGEESTHTKYPRAKHLQRLLRSARICLASKGVLEDLLKHELVKTDTELYKYVFDSLMYKVDVGRRHGSWPEAAYRRRSSGLQHVMVFVESNCNDVKAYNLDDGSVLTWTTIPNVKATQKSITVFDNNLLVLAYSSSKKVHVIKLYNEEDRWQDVSEISSCETNLSLGSFVAHDLHIYFYFRKTCYPYTRGLKRMKMMRVKLDYELKNASGGEGEISSAVPFDKYIIVFNNDTINAVDTVSESHWKLDSIDGPMENIISFAAYDDTYILQRNGKMWKILHKASSEKVGLESVAKLWNFDWDIYGGIFYRDKLFIFGNTQSEQRDGQSRQSSVPDIFDHIEYVFINSCTRCLPMVIKRREL